MIKKNIIIPALAGAFLTLAYPNFKLGFLAYIGMIPIFYFVKDVSFKHAFNRGFFWGLGLNSASLYWICYDTVKGGIASILFLAFLTAVVFIFVNRGMKIFGSNFIFAFPFIWTAWEFLRSVGILGFPWLSIAYTQTYYTSLIQYVSITGVFGVSFWICIINVTIYYILINIKTRKKIPAVLILLIIFVVPFTYGKIKIKRYQHKNNPLKIALIQGNIPAKIKLNSTKIRENFNTYIRLSKDAIKRKPDVIIWPESAAYCYLRHNSLYRKLLRNLVNELKTPVITGSLDSEYDKSNDRLKYYNSAFLIEPFSSELEVYSKIHLVPFSEWVPFSDVLPFLYKFDASMGDFSQGKYYKVFNLSNDKISAENTGALKNIKLSVVICFESIFSDLVRKFCHKGARLLVIITNDAWFGKTSAPYQHAQIAVFRAIENRIPIARCANTGVSMFIDKMGRVTKQSNIYTESVLIDKIYIENEKTFYTRFGDIFSYIITAVGTILMLISIIRK